MCFAILPLSWAKEEVFCASVLRVGFRASVFGFIHLARRAGMCVYGLGLRFLVCRVFGLLRANMSCRAGC